MINPKSFFKSIPTEVKRFLGKALLFFIVWKVVYNIFLYDSKYLDHPLTTHVGNASAWLINQLGDMEGFTAKREVVKHYFEGGVNLNESSAIYHHDRIVLYIANVCNGLELIVLYIGFIVCMPASFLRKLKYIVIGVIILDLTNILRCTGLIYLREYYEIYFDFAHHYLFNTVVYTATFIMWYVFSRKITLKTKHIEKTVQAG
ncbi:hypothetical protein FUA26_06315 [Seonamhaeicola algicola]|uniref:Exosortase/archaeosortase family protein n=1 Tax=Seonamhaeicola algicola TaxID=1719036 RepID=A0A5C7ASH9_9FLAO|nr:exosortase/archaeosortase family protein [Seonamhaeicola algicola]TXE11678.1 hypothetical protein FUA26_06315 [Seonamhaeicola algicola]